MADAEERFYRSEITATKLLHEASDIYGRLLNKKMKHISDRLLTSIEQQRDEILLEALRQDRLNEMAVRENTANTQWHCEDAIKWDVDGIDERLRVMGMQPMEDVIICKICRQPTESNNCCVPCGCQSSCLPCLKKARAKNGLCPHPSCGQAIVDILTLAGKLLTKSKERIEAEQMSHEHSVLIAGDVVHETSNLDNHRYEAVAGPSGTQRNKRSISSNSGWHRDRRWSRSASPRRNHPKRNEGK